MGLTTATRVVLHDGDHLSDHVGGGESVVVEEEGVIEIASQGIAEGDVVGAAEAVVFVESEKSDVGIFVSDERGGTVAGVVVNDDGLDVGVFLQRKTIEACRQQMLAIVI